MTEQDVVLREASAPVVASLWTRSLIVGAPPPELVLSPPRNPI
jgi:hypothetical protein